MMLKKVKERKCRICKSKYTPWRALQTCCSRECEFTYAMASIEKKNKREALNTRRETKQAIERIKTKSEWLKEAQSEFNKFIRIRDANYPCISCNRWHTGQYHCGHYRSVGSSPHLRFSELNCHKQCSVCNNHLSGNIMHYRIGLIAKIGIEEVERLEADNEAKHYSVEEIKAIKIKYKQLTKKLRENHE